MLRRTTAATALTAGLLTAACGGDAGDLFDEGGGVADPADDGVTETVPVDDQFDEFDDPDVPDWDGPNELSLEFDEFRVAVREAFDDNDTGRGTSNMWPAPTVDVEVRPGSMTDDEILAACEALTDWLFERPEDEAIGPVFVQISQRESDAMMEDGELIAVNEELIPREERGVCQLV